MESMYEARIEDLSRTAMEYLPTFQGGATPKPTATVPQAPVEPPPAAAPVVVPIFWMQLGNTMIKLMPGMQIRALGGWTVPEYVNPSEKDDTAEINDPHPVDHSLQQCHFPTGHFQTTGQIMRRAAEAAGAALAKEKSERVTIWNPTERRKLSGNAAPFRSNLQEYLMQHPV